MTGSVNVSSNGTASVVCGSLSGTMTVAGTSSVVANSGVGISASVCRPTFSLFSSGVPGVEEPGLSASTCHYTMRPSLSSTKNESGPLTSPSQASIS